MLRALCGVCRHPILIDTETGAKFDSQDIGHRHKTPTKSTFIPGQYSNEQIIEMTKNETKGTPKPIQLYDASGRHRSEYLIASDVTTEQIRLGLDLNKPYKRTYKGDCLFIS